MRFMIIIDHPWKNSFNHAILARITARLESRGHAVDVLDLHDEDFDPVMHVDELAVYKQGKTLDPAIGGYQARVNQADHLIFVFPVWWEVMPALLKGWIDKVFLPEWAFTEADAAPLLTFIKTATAITTMGAPEVIHTSVERMLLKGVLEFCGVTETFWLNLCAVSEKTDAEREAWLADIDAHLDRLA